MRPMSITSLAALDAIAAAGERDDLARLEAHHARDAAFFAKHGRHVPANDDAPKDKGTFRFEMLAELDPNPRKDWTVYGFLGKGEFSTLYGEPGSGKSIVAADIALHVAAGLAWFDRAVTEGPVIYFAAERGGLMARRLAGLQRCREVSPDIPLCLASGTLDIRADAAARKFIDEIRRLEDDLGDAVGLVVLDTFSRALSGGDENSSVDVGNAVKNIEQIRERTGSHIMAVHHVGVSAEAKTRMRGSSLILGAIDSGALVTKGNQGVTVKVTKSNDGPDDFELRVGVASFVTGIDAEGNDVTIPHLVEAVGNMVGRPPIVSLSKKLTKTGAAGLAALAKAIAQSGELPPDDAPDCPAGVPSVSFEAWQAALHVDGQKEQPIPSPDAIRMRLRRASGELAETGHVGSNGSRFWIAK